LLVKVNIEHYEKKGYGKLVNHAPGIIKAMQGRLGAPISGLAYRLPKIGKKARSIDNIVFFDNEKITLFGKKKGIDILYKNVKISKEKQSMKITINIDEIELDKFVDNMVESFFNDKSEMNKNDLLLKNMLKTVNETSEGDAKYELLSYIIKWANKNDMFNKLIETAVKTDEGIGKKLNKLELKLGNIEFEY